MKVVYGHTDSIYVQIDSVEKAEEAIKEIESSVRKHFPNVMGLKQHPVVLEFEKYYSALGVGTTKNRNAGMITWKDGEWLDEPEFVMTGFTAKRVSETKLAKGVQTDVLTMWVNEKPMTEINNYLHDKYNAVINGNIPIDNIIKRSRLREDRFTVKCRGCGKKHDLHGCLSIRWCLKCGEDTAKFTTLEGRRPSIGSGIAGVVYAKQNGINFDDSYLYLKVRSNETYTNPLTKEVRTVEYVSGSRYVDFDKYKPDYQHYADQVIKKAEPIYKAMNWDLSNIKTGKIQTKLEEWF
tara:strand:- start:1809 stop:2690 length:882 start_codon:yes stop_codon:yes gene_type:complete